MLPLKGVGGDFSCFARSSDRLSLVSKSMLWIAGGVGYTPDFLRRQIRDIKKHLASPDLPFGIDLLLPQVGGSARKVERIGVVIY